MQLFWTREGGREREQEYFYNNIECNYVSLHQEFLNYIRYQVLFRLVRSCVICHRRIMRQLTVVSCMILKGAWPDMRNARHVHVMSLQWGKEKTGRWIQVSCSFW